MKIQSKAVCSVNPICGRTSLFGTSAINQRRFPENFSLARRSRQPGSCRGMQLLFARDAAKEINEFLLENGEISKMTRISICRRVPPVRKLRARQE